MKNCIAVTLHDAHFKNKYVCVLNVCDGADGGSRKRLEHNADWLVQRGEGCLSSVKANPYNDVIALSPAFCVNSKDDVINHVYV